jgi:predicted transposase YbfD/YdcC
MIDIRSATVTTDAINTQKSIAAKIVSKGADYALPVKENHKNLKLDIELQFDVSAIDRRNS